MKRIWIFLLAVAALTACAPVAEVVADQLERSDGATLTYGVQSLIFDPGPAEAVSVIVRAEGDDLRLLSVPDGATCEVTTTNADCRLGTVTEAVTIGMTGGGVVANATWRRAGASTVYLTFADVPGPVEEAP